MNVAYSKYRGKFERYDGPYSYNYMPRSSIWYGDYDEYHNLSAHRSSTASTFWNGKPFSVEKQNIDYTPEAENNKLKEYREMVMRVRVQKGAAQPTCKPQSEGLKLDVDVQEQIDQLYNKANRAKRQHPTVAGIERLKQGYASRPLAGIKVNCAICSQRVFGFARFAFSAADGDEGINLGPLHNDCLKFVVDKPISVTEEDYIVGLF